MTTFVGAEYLIASMLIEKSKQHYSSEVTLEELGKYGIYVQSRSVIGNINAVFLTSKSQFYNAIFDFSDYFECLYDSNGQLKGIRIEKTRNVDDLENRFMGYLPEDIFEFLSEITKSYAA